MFELLLIILEQTLAYVPLVLGAYLTIGLMKVPDLTLETAFVAGAFFSAAVLGYSTAIPIYIALGIAITISLCAGAMVGTFVSILCTKCNLPHILSCIIVFGIFHGIFQLISHGYISLSAQQNPLSLLAYIPKHPEILMLSMISFSVLGMIFYVLQRQLGYAYAVYGINPHFFNNYGGSRSYIFMSGIILSNGLAGLSGYLIAQTNGHADMHMGIGKVLLCVTSLALGTLCYKKNVIKSAIIPISGIILYISLQQLLLQIGFNLTFFTMIQALVVMIVVIYLHRTQRFSKAQQIGI